MGDGTETQKLWLTKWGTMTALVWAQTAENAELRVRHQVFDRKATPHEVTQRPAKVNGAVIVLREATERDRQDFAEAGALPA